MDKEFIINLVINQIGEEQAKNVKEQLLTLADKMSADKIYIIKKLGNRGLCLISTSSKDCKVSFNEGAKPDIIEVENMLRDIEI